MGNKVFVGGLSWGTSEATLRDEFEKCGEVVDAKIIKDRETGKSKGFGFVTFENDKGASNAILHMNQTDLDGRNITVSEAQDRKKENNFNRGSGGGGRRRDYNDRRW